MKMLLTCFVIFLSVAQCFAQTQAQVDYSKNIVQVTVTFQEYDPFLPWQKKNTGVKSGYGVVVGPYEIITTENLVRNNTLIELRKSGSGEKIPATVVLADEQANLALIKISDGSDLQGVFPLQLSDNVTRNGDVTMLQFDETAQIQHGKAQVVQLSMKPLPYAPYPTLTFTILTDLNINGEGSAAIRDGKLSGIVMSYDRSTRTGSMMPAITIKHFLADVMQPPYKGFASAGFVWTFLVDPAKRKYFNVNSHNKGILVLDTMPGSGASETLQSNDVILEWDGYSIDNLGFYEDPDFGRLSFIYLVMGRRSPGDVIPAKIIRNGKQTEVTVKLTRRIDRDALVPENITHQRDEYIVEGGFIIRELTGAYLSSYGQDWRRNVDPRIVNIYLTKKNHPDKNDEKVLILAGVLPNPINIGYQQFRDDVITKINGKPVNNITDVFNILKKDGSIQRVTIKSMDVDLILDQTMLTDANDELAGLYRIPNLRYQRPLSQQ
ncbi:MAG: hypothetical protein A2283_00860 [Lentisphaerae bacterium RIFOXYA12_FULL_48_11]|nr:MAG: hypothetical protein A2283_00860 [Lentisphaerae bacterium RIFOXYA12_FULL_48_11]